MQNFSPLSPEDVQTIDFEAASPPCFAPTIARAQPCSSLPWGRESSDVVSSASEGIPGPELWQGHVGYGTGWDTTLEDNTVDGDSSWLSESDKLIRWPWGWPEASRVSKVRRSGQGCQSYVPASSLNLIKFLLSPLSNPCFWYRDWCYNFLIALLSFKIIFLVLSTHLPCCSQTEKPSIKHEVVDGTGSMLTIRHFSVVGQVWLHAFEVTSANSAHPHRKQSGIVFVEREFMEA